ncbi:precorrin-8X methylmutase [Aphanothece hegewaldii CCALA 016]|uniref:Precorrin-8X methylmutase n=1 Tax=Aphanothece hegewaldii CCALA 016 TaxID=2107694 RepID=A0A2T1LVW2_9CHRO|nr:precorrin-8X methylmutase [Aphanothece hegewaldii]PSF36001.1 precorrin-8X methylmutase [Aphanothece hegewaldii CCALA 016]
MEWHITDVQNLAVIDQEIENNELSPAMTEIVRRIILETADFEYQNLMQFSERALNDGAAALAARSTIIVDTLMVHVGIASNLQQTFANPVYCATETITRPQKDKTKAEWGIQTLARRYPEAIFVIGQSLSTLTALVELIEEQEVKPALVISTPTAFIEADIAKERLKDADVPYIAISGRKGGAMVAVAIVNALVDLTWQAYGQNPNAQG